MSPEVGLRVTHRRYVPYSQAHYAGNLVDGAYSLQLFGDVATELAVSTDGDEGLLASYSEVQFVAPVRAGDILEVTGELIGVGNRSRRIRFTATVMGRGNTDGAASAAGMLPRPIVATTAIGTVVVPGPEAGAS